LACPCGWYGKHCLAFVELLLLAPFAESGIEMASNVLDPELKILIVVEARQEHTN
jgi:hypothetical protein